MAPVLAMASAEHNVAGGPEEFPEDSPFYGLGISSHAPLRALRERYICAGCGKSSRYFCYRCVMPAPGLQDSLPSLRLPLSLTVIKHARELQGKSTAVHAKLLAPADAEILTYDPVRDVVEGLDASYETGCVLLFPADTAKKVEETDWADVRRLVVIDGTWQQAKAMLRSKALSGITRRVRLSEAHRTAFWRYQSLGPHCLSTIEAIYRLYQEWAVHRNGAADPQLDNLLYFFSFFYGLIQHEYTVCHPDRTFTPKHTHNYIVGRRPQSKCHRDE